MRDWGLVAVGLVIAVVVALVLFAAFDVLPVIVGIGVTLALWTMFRRVGDP